MVEDYMAVHQSDQTAVALWSHFRTVIDRLKAVFPTYRKPMQGEEAVINGGNIYVDSEGIVRDGGGRRIEGIEVHSGRESTLDYPMFTDEDGKVDGVDMTVAENRMRLHNEMAGITEDDEKQLKGRMSNPKQMQHKAFVFDRHEKNKGKRWKYEAKVGVPLDPTVVHDTPEFPLGSVMVVREGKDPE